MKTNFSEYEAWPLMSELYAVYLVFKHIVNVYTYWPIGVQSSARADVEARCTVALACTCLYIRSGPLLSHVLRFHFKARIFHSHI